MEEWKKRKWIFLLDQNSLKSHFLLKRILHTNTKIKLPNTAPIESQHQSKNDTNLPGVKDWWISSIIP